jgi:hypothetical protein
MPPDGSSPTRTRTWNKPVNSRKDARHKDKQDKAFGDTPARFVRGFAQAEGEQSGEPAPAAVTDPDLARILDAWPTLPAHIKAAILALMATVG